MVWHMLTLIYWAHTLSVDCVNRNCRDGCVSDHDEFDSRNILLLVRKRLANTDLRRVLLMRLRRSSLSCHLRESSWSAGSIAWE